MSESLKKAVRPLASALAALLGLGAPAWATYGGGACHSCAPAPVIATSCNVVTLAPQCQTVTQTAYETVYENVPYTVMTTRYRLAYRPESYQVMRPVTQTSYVQRPRTVCRPVTE